MKILILQDYLRSGGTERQTALLANAFADAGHVTRLITFRPGGALDANINERVTRRTLQRIDLGLDWFAPGLRKAVLAAEPDIVLCMGRMANCYAGTVQRALNRRRPGAAVVATMRTGKRLPLSFRRSLAEVPHVVANSRDARDTLIREYRVPDAKIWVIHNSLVFPPESTLTRNETLRRQHGATDRTNVMVCVAMFRPEKNQRELIEIVARLPPTADWQLWLGGDGPARAACEARAAALRLESRVKFLGFEADPSPIYRAADIAVHASWSEALSNFLIEAQAHGLPAVAYEAQGIRECFIPLETGWAIPRDDHEAFRSALLRLMAESASERAERSALAREAARQTFDPARQVAAYLELFERIRADRLPT
ncbi:MAG: glycosyltransferase [Opitutaceae bacterium]|nr:glycosyltransferase [Opitutaceae bacterium]